MSKSPKLQIEPPQLSRKRKVPAKLQIGNSNPEQLVCVKDWYRRQYYEAAKLVINCVKARFHQPGYQLYRHSEGLLLNAANGESFEEDLHKVTDFCQDDFSPELLRSRLECLNTSFKRTKEGKCRVEMKMIIKHVKSNSSVERTFYSKVTKLLKLILVMPPTNAISERSFSALRRIKSYLIPDSH